MNSEYLDTDLAELRRNDWVLADRPRVAFSDGVFAHPDGRYHLPDRLDAKQTGLIPYDGYVHLMSRRFIEAPRPLAASSSSLASLSAIVFSRRARLNSTIQRIASVVARRGRTSTGTW